MEVDQTVNTSGEDISETKPASYLPDLSFKYFASEPLRMIFDHKRLLELCLENNNPEAHYVKGI